MAKGSGTTKTVSSGSAGAARTTASVSGGGNSVGALENKILNAGFSKTANSYSYDDYDVSISIREYTAGNGQKYYSFDMSSDGQGSSGTFTKEEVSKFVSKSPYDLSKAVKSYLKDSFTPGKVVTQADSDALKKKYFGI